MKKQLTLVDRAIIFATFRGNPEGNEYPLYCAPH